MVQNGSVMAHWKLKDKLLTVNDVTTGLKNNYNTHIVYHNKYRQSYNDICSVNRILQENTSLQKSCRKLDRESSFRLLCFF